MLSSCFTIFNAYGGLREILYMCSILGDGHINQCIKRQTIYCVELY